MGQSSQQCCKLQEGVRMSGILHRLLLCSAAVISHVNGGCSFSGQDGQTVSQLKDLDAAKFAAKMALAHQGVDLEVIKERKERNAEYIPTFATDEKETKEAEVEEGEVTLKDDDIWSLSERSNSKNKIYYDQEKKKVA